MIINEKMQTKINITRVKIIVPDYSRRGKFITLDDYYTCDKNRIPDYMDLIHIEDNYKNSDGNQQVLCGHLDYEYTKEYGVIPVRTFLVGYEDNGQEVILFRNDDAAKALPFEQQLNEEVWQLMSTKRMNACV